MNQASVRSQSVTLKAIDEIPLEKRSNICTEIDYSIHARNGYWERLVSELGFSERDSKNFILSFERSQSPTENLLRECTYRNYRIGTLCHVLRKIGLVKLAEENLENMGEKYTPSPSSLPWVGTMPAAFERSLRATDGGSLNSSNSGSDGDKIGGLDTIHYPYEEIEKGTKYFSADMKLGAGAFGKVYKVNLKNTMFACKVLTIINDSPHFSIVSKHKEQSDLRNELRYLAEYRHPNIIPLYGWSLDGKDPCLIYQYMKNGSLQDCLQRLKGNKSLSWLTRAKIACDAARGLQFLHEAKDKPLIHGDIKTANILLDGSFSAKLGDFGLAREGPRRLVTGSYVKLNDEHTPGTMGYLAMEYMQSKKLSVQVDTYAYGVVLLELYTGRRAFDRTDKKPATLLRDYMDSIAKGLGEGGPENAEDRLFEHQSPDMNSLPRNTALKFVRLALECCHEKRNKRPAMSVVLERLEAIHVEIEELTEQLSASIVKNSFPAVPIVSAPNDFDRLHWLPLNSKPMDGRQDTAHMSRTPVESDDRSLQQPLKDSTLSRQSSEAYSSMNSGVPDESMRQLRISDNAARQVSGQTPHLFRSPWAQPCANTPYPCPMVSESSFSRAPVWPAQVPMWPVGMHPSYFLNPQFPHGINHTFSMHCANMANFMSNPSTVSNPNSDTEPKSDPTSITPISPGTPLTTPEPFSSLDLDGGLSPSGSSPQFNVIPDGTYPHALQADPYMFHPSGAFSSAPPCHEHRFSHRPSGEAAATSVPGNSQPAVTNAPVKVSPYKADLMERLKQYHEDQDGADIISKVFPQN